MKRSLWLAVAVAGLLVFHAAVAAAQQITPPNLRVQPLGDEGTVSWITLGGYMEIGSPVFSPDGEWVAFDAREKGFYGSDAEVWIARREGTDLHKLVGGATPRWSPDGKQLLFMRARSKKPGVTLGIFVIDRDGKNERWVCPGRWPDWSPDGKRIAFSRDAKDVPAGGVKPLARIYVADADGTNEELICAGDCPSWSPDGKKLACSWSDKAFGAPMIRIVELKSGKQTIIGYGWFRPCWAPDGKSVVANGISPAKTPAMVRLSTVQVGPPKVLFPELGRGASPCISADGEYMVFVADRPANDSEE